MTRVDHIALVVADTEAALATWRDKFGFPVVLSEVVNAASVRLTHLDMGNLHLQLVEPLVKPHPLWDWLEQHPQGIHHLCFAVDQIETGAAALAAQGIHAGEPAPHQGTQGKRALFLDRADTEGFQIELTGQ